jgi:HSP20 family protein
VLHIAGERASTAPPAGGKVNVWARERSTGQFTRAIALSDDVDPAHVKASYRDGVLQISIARHEASQPKRIAVQ